jgi:hypothetical protein
MKLTQLSLADRRYCRDNHRLRARPYCRDAADPSLLDGMARVDDCSDRRRRSCHLGCDGRGSHSSRYSDSYGYSVCCRFRFFRPLFPPILCLSSLQNRRGDNVKIQVKGVSWNLFSHRSQLTTLLAATTTKPPKPQRQKQPLNKLLRPRTPPLPLRLQSSLPRPPQQPQPLPTSTTPPMRLLTRAPTSTRRTPTRTAFLSALIREVTRAATPPGLARTNGCAISSFAFPVDAA